MAGSPTSRKPRIERVETRRVTALTAPERAAHWRLGARLMLAAIYIGFGIVHLTRADSLIPLMPPWVPAPHAVVLFTGGCEVLGGVGLLVPRVRWLAGLMLAIYAVCVWPANLHHALAHVSVPPIPDSWWYHAPRLAFQPVFVWWALFAGGVIDWPFPRARQSREPVRDA